MIIIKAITYIKRTANRLYQIFTIPLYIAFVLLCHSVSAYSQSISGHLISQSDLAPIIGAIVIEKGTNNGVTVDKNGFFFLNLSKDSSIIECSCLGFETRTIAINGRTNIGVIKMKESVQYLSDIIISSQVATARRTPIAASTLSRIEIRERMGNQEFTELLKYTPSVHINRQGGGWCDSEIFMRGFDNTNIAVNINGINMNDVENGAVYWSNWAGISDVVSVLQTQRGVGTSKLSSPSVGGTINIITKGIDTKKGGSIYYIFGNDAYNKVAFDFSSGLTSNGWALSLLGSYTSGNGYAQGTAFSSYNYFMNLSKRISESHQISFLFFGAPQKHYGRSNALTHSEWDKVKTFSIMKKHWSRYNPDFGVDANGERKSTDYNEYHMPQVFINHIWTITPQSTLSSTVYTSIGRGNGYIGYGRDEYSEYDWYGADNGLLSTKFRKNDGSFDYAMIEDINRKAYDGAKMIVAKQCGNHDWYGLSTSYENQFSDVFSLMIGMDMRYTKATHVNTISDLFGGKYYIDNSRKDVSVDSNPLANNLNWVNAHLNVGDVVGRDYDSFIMKEGLFSQLEYASSKLSAFISGSINNSTYWRYDRLYYSKENALSDKYDFIGGTVKSGANFNFSNRSNLYINIGWISKAPQFKNGVFMSANTSNVINNEVKNEQSVSIDLGYGFHNNYLSLNASGYYTKWLDKTMTKKGKMANKTQYYINMTGVNAKHMGIEFDISLKPATWVNIRAMASLGHWTWDSDKAKGYAYDINGNALSIAGKITSPGSSEHAWAVIRMKGIKVGGSAQTTAAIQALFEPLDRLRIGGGYNLYANNYAYYSIGGGSLTLGKEMVVSTPWKIPMYGNLDMNASYNFSLGFFLATISVQVYNVLNKYNIEKAWNPSIVGIESTEVASSDVYMFFTPGRTWSAKLTIEF